MKKASPDIFPLLISKGHSTVKIYRTRNRGKDLFTLAYQTPDGRVRVNFTDLAEAKREAVAKVASLSRCDSEALKLTGEDRQRFVAAVEALEPTGIGLDIAAREFAVAFEILGHDAIIEAARFYKRHVEAELPDLSTQDAVARFSEAKAAEGMSPLYLKDIRLILGRLATAFQCDLKGIMADDLRDYMNRLKVGPVAKNNHRRLIVALFNFAKAQGWLRKGESTAADAIGAVKVKTKDVSIYTPEEMARLVAAADETFLPCVALIGFGGVRREELAKGLPWEAVDFDRNCIIVPAAIAKTGKKRKIEMPKNLRALLMPYRGKTGVIFGIDPRKRMAKVIEAANRGRKPEQRIAWKRNGLRHSFGSYRMEATKNAGQVALEMGNSPAVVMAHYFEIVDSKAAKAYWKILPAPASKILEFKAA